MSRSAVKAEDRPIGYWLKHLDRLLEAAFERELSEQGLSRRHWQTLNVVRASALDESGIEAELRPFWGEGEVSVASVVGELVRRGWLDRRAEGRYSLTRQGEGGHSTLERRVQGIRSLLLDGVSRDDYQVTMGVLQKMAENLEGTYEWSG